MHLSDRDKVIVKSPEQYNDSNNDIIIISRPRSLIIIISATYPKWSNNMPVLRINAVKNDIIIIIILRFIYLYHSDRTDNNIIGFIKIRKVHIRLLIITNKKKYLI